MSHYDIKVFTVDLTSDTLDYRKEKLFLQYAEHFTLTVFVPFFLHCKIYSPWCTSWETKRFYFRFWKILFWKYLMWELFCIILWIKLLALWRIRGLGAFWQICTFSIFFVFMGNFLPLQNFFVLWIPFYELFQITWLRMFYKCRIKLTQALLKHHDG